MRLTKVLVLAGVSLAAALTALPASAQAGYYGYRGDPGYSGDPCAVGRSKDNQIGGMILGGIIGGVLGSQVSGRGHRDDGTALGAVVGGALGSEIGRGARTAPCAPPPGYNTGYNTAPVYDDGLYGAPPPPDYPVYDDRDYDRGYDRDRVRHDRRRLAERDRYAYKNNGDYAGTDCTSAEQVTRLPDGTRISRPVEACREARYGGWTVRD